MKRKNKEKNKQTNLPRRQFDSNKGKRKKRFSYFEKLTDSYRRTHFD